MKDDDCNNDPQSFILRIWNDADSRNGKTKTWRGSIVHVGTGNRIYFHNLNSIPHFIQKQTGMGYGVFYTKLKLLFDWVSQIITTREKK
jgi:hypothetical protein